MSGRFIRAWPWCTAHSRQIGLSGPHAYLKGVILSGRSYACKACVLVMSKPLQRNILLHDDGIFSILREKEQRGFGTFLQAFQFLRLGCDDLHRIEAVIGSPCLHARYFRFQRAFLLCRGLLPCNIQRLFRLQISPIAESLSLFYTMWQVIKVVGAFFQDRPKQQRTSFIINLHSSYIAYRITGSSRNQKETGIIDS